MTDHLKPRPPSLWFSTLTADTDASYRDRAIVSGHGCTVVDASGREYIDARSALWNATLGYDNQRVIEAVTRQLHRLPVGQIIRHDQPPQVDLDYAERLVSALPAHLTQVRFCTTGAQAVEGAVMLSRFVRRQTGEPRRRDVIALWDGYHGIGGLASSLTGETPLHEIEGTSITEVHHVRPLDLDALRHTVERVGPNRITAILLEPILGTGFVELGADYLYAVAELCGQHGIHLIVDEVTTGFGRTGALTVTGSLGIAPDMMILSKGITAGYLPLAAIAVTAAVATVALGADVVFPHGSTSDGHPLAMAAADAVLTELTDGGILDQVRTRGRQLTDALRAHAVDVPAITRIHGPGLMVAVTVAGADGEAVAAPVMAAIKEACREAGLLVSLCGSMVLLTPPFVITADEVEAVAARLCGAVRSVMAEASAPKEPVGTSAR